ncbi:MAG: potassium/proton antiporter [Chloroflexi bacterium]|nr:potassium/proton antiporter [Chloroflexota bacterium]
MVQLETILLGFAILVLLSILASKLSFRMGVPALLLFLGIGMLAGSEGPGGISFDNPWLAQSVGVVALAFILFAGGLDTNWVSTRPVLSMGVGLATVGVLLTALLLGAFTHFVAGVSWVEGLLLGAIVSSTDAAAVFSIMRSKNLSLQGGLKPLLELESGSNDPMAVLLTVSVLSFIAAPSTDPLTLVGQFFQQMALGAVLGFLSGRGSALLINRLRLEYEGLYPVLTTALVILTYAAANLLGGNGFLATYVAGLTLGNANFVHKRTLRRFHDGQAWLMQITMFLTLGLQAFPSRLLPVTGAGLLVSAFLMLVARPVSVLLTLARSPLSMRERIFVSWVGLRGAAPIVLATFPFMASVPAADTIFHLVFFVVLVSVVCQGTSIPLVARWLKVDAPLSLQTNYPIEFDPAAWTRGELVELLVDNGSAAAGRPIVDLAFPNDVLIVLLNRSGEYIIPYGGTTIEAGDRLLVLAERRSLDEAVRIVQAQTAPDAAAD